MQEEQKQGALYFDPKTFELYERDPELIELPSWVSVRPVGGSSFSILYKMSEPEIFILLKRAFDSASEKEKEAFKPRFLFIREKAIALFGEAKLKEAAKALKAEPGRKLGFRPAEIVQANIKNYILLKAPGSENAELFPPIEPARQPHRSPIAEPEAVAACFELITGVLDEIRKSYIYNAPRLRELASKLSEAKDLNLDELKAAEMIASGPLAWVKVAHPALALQVKTIEAALEQSAVIGALGAVELSAGAFLGHWQKILRDWQTQVDKHFPNLNSEGEAQ